MRFGVTLGAGVPVMSPEFIVGYARAAEELGFDSVWFPDHVVIPLGHSSQYPYGEQMPYEDDPNPDPLIMLSYVAAATSTIRLGTSILILPQRNPVVLAKQVATLDVLSGGRVDLGIGIGWLREEFEALGVPWRQRGRRTDEYIEAMRALWTQDEASYEGETVRFERLRCDPRPLQPGGVPIIIGGHTLPAARRAGRLGDGFLPNAQGRAWRELLTEMRDAAEAAGRDPDAIEIIAGGAPDPSVIERLSEFGVTRMNFVISAQDVDGARRAMSSIMEQAGRSSA